MVRITFKKHIISNILVVSFFVIISILQACNPEIPLIIESPTDTVEVGLDYEILRSWILGDKGYLTHIWGEEECKIWGALEGCKECDDCKHTGVDFGTSGVYEDVYAVADGEIVGFGGPTGKICIFTETMDITFCYLHLSSIARTYGRVSKGDFIGKVGMVGADSVHLHFEARKGHRKYGACCFEDTLNPVESAKNARNVSIIVFPTIEASATQILKTTPTLSATSQLDMCNDEKMLQDDDPYLILQCITYLVDKKKARLISALVGEGGTQFAPYATGMHTDGFRSGNDVALILEQAISDVEPKCLGFDIGGDRSAFSIYFQDIMIDWTALGFEDISDSGNMSQFLFWWTENGWILRYITPLPEWAVPDWVNLDKLQRCPEL